MRAFQTTFLRSAVRPILRQSISSTSRRVATFGLPTSRLTRHTKSYFPSPLAVVAASSAASLLTIAALAPTQSAEAAAVDAEAMYQAKLSPIDQLSKLLTYYEQFESSAEITWRLGRAYYDVAQEPDTSPEKQKEYIYKALELVKTAVDQDPENFACHKWYGILLSEIGKFEGTKRKIGDSYVVREHWEKAVQLNPADPTSRHLLGAWCFGVASISWIEWQVARAVFATPPSSSWQEALDFFLEAENLKPGFWNKNQLMIAQCYLKLGNKGAAREWATKAAAVPALKAADKETAIEIAALQKKLQ